LLENWITDELTLKRYKRFKKRKSAIIAVATFSFLVFLSLTAELWANNKPILMFFDGRLLVPVYFDYHPTTFGRSDILQMDYRALKNDHRNSFDLWPLVEWNPYESNEELTSYPSKPSASNLFGTDDRGRDVLTRLLYGFRYSIGFAVLVWLVSYALGILIGSIMGFSGGIVDLIGMRVFEVWESLPALTVLITLIAILDPSFILLVSFQALFGWMMIAVYMRAEFLKLRKREFVEAAQALGVSKYKIMFKHILPNALAPIITFSPFAVASGITALTALDYLGFGLKPPTPSWGELLQQAKGHFTTAWWLAVYPSVAIFMTVFSLNMIGEAIRDAFDPRK
jgi:microcin C transport system permease protein